MDLASLRTLVQQELLAVDQLIDECLQSEITLIQQLGQHIIQSGGKRLRPLLVLLSARTFGYAQGTAHIELATVIELVHTATLLHDDVVDNSNTRRGKRTANALWDNAASILVGDFLYSRAFQLMVRVDSMRVMQILAQTTNVMAQGEILQLLNCKNPQATETTCLEVIRAKTGILFATAAELGAVLCGQPETVITAMREYGMHLGIAFQLVDDALDYHASTETLGKNPGDDLAEGKITLPLAYALTQGAPAQTDNIRNMIQHASNVDRDQVFAVIKATDAIAYTYEIARQYAKSAIAFLDKLPDSTYRRALIALAEFAVARTY